MLNRRTLLKAGAAFGAMAESGLAIDALNAKGGLLGKKLEAVVVDPAYSRPRI